MISKPQTGFSLLELMAVICILGFATTTITLSSKDSTEASLEQVSKKLRETLAITRLQAMYSDLPYAITIAAHEVGRAVWNPDFNEWQQSTQKGLMRTNKKVSLNIESSSVPDFLTTKKSATASDNPEIAVIFWPDGSNTFAEISMSSAGEDSALVTIFSSGVVQ